MQIDGPKRHIYIKLSDPTRIQDILTMITGQAEYRHSDGVISKVRIEAVGLAIRKVRIANLPPDIANSQVRSALGKFGEIREVHNDAWSNAYRYPVRNGVRIVTINLTKLIPSHISVEGHRSLISYEGQPQTCYGCNEMGHQYSVCPDRWRKGAGETGITTPSWADIIATGSKAKDKIGERELGTITTTMAAEMSEGNGRSGNVTSARTPKFNKTSARSEVVPIAAMKQ